MQLEFDKDLIESRQLATEFKKLKDFIMFFESLFVGEAVLSLY